jgi:hypothetical protein
MNMKYNLCSEKYETFEIWAMFTLEGPHIVMSRTDAQNELDFHFNIRHTCHAASVTQLPNGYGSREA